MKNLRTLFQNKLFFINIALWTVYGLINYILIMFTSKYKLGHCLLLSLVFGSINYFITIMFYEKYAELKNINQILQESINKDALTGLLNRRAFGEHISKFNKKSAYSVIFTDIDNFREFNNKYGHEIGDIVLKKVGKTIKSNVEDEGKVYRYGGEEIVIMLSNCSKAVAVKIAEKIRLSILNIDNKPYSNITISLGVSSYPEDGEDINTIVKLADNALLNAKQQGKNCTFSN